LIDAEFLAQIAWIRNAGKGLQLILLVVMMRRKLMTFGCGIGSPGLAAGRVGRVIRMQIRVDFSNEINYN
jgi:hypothetical protein